MTPVDLNRLREACDAYQERVGPLRKVTLEVLAVTGEIVLDAPTVWWCEVIRDIEIDPSECDNCDPALGCGPVHLVPVKGADHET